MRVAFFISNPLTVYGGFEKILDTVIDYLNSNGVETTIYKLAGEHEPIPSKENWVEPYRSHQCVIARYHWPRYLTEKMAYWFGEYKINSKGIDLEKLRQTDVVVINYPLLLKPVSLFLRQLSFKGKIVGWFHDSLYASTSKIKSLIKKFLSKIFTASNLKRFDLILAISTKLAEQVKELAPDVKVIVVGNPVLSARYKDISPIDRARKIIFAYVGRLDERRKNLKFMFKGLSKLDFDWKLKIVGTGPDEQMLKEYAKKLGISDKIEWLGFSKEPFELLRGEGVTALLLTSRFEGLPTVLIEAVSYGIPVISSDCETGPSDIVVPGVNGYLYRTGDLKDFIEKVKGLVEGRLHLSKPSEMRKTVEKFDIEKVCKSIHDILLSS
ncbi:glycosyltransferase [Pseudothermotoga sp.]|uniref:glycosyltransferase n=1 Tax=Pseudothermotoga sp. TaxID=2033661 RepID=UPI0031F6DAA4